MVRLLRLRIALVLLAIGIVAPPAQAGFRFGLGSAAAKRSAEVIDRAARAENAPQTPGGGDPSASSRLIWTYTGEPIAYSPPAVGADGTIYFATSHHFVYYASYWTQGQKPPAVAYGL